MPIEVIYPHSDRITRHDVRWIRRLRASGFSVNTVPDSELEQFSMNHSGSRHLSVVLAGDLERGVECVALGLSPVVGLSWGSDLWHEVSFERLLQRRDELERMTAIIVDNGASLERLENIARFTPTHVIPWGVNTTLFRPNYAHEFHKSESRVVLSLRTHDELHGVRDVIQAYCIAASMDQGLNLVVAGSGPETDEYRQQVERHGLSNRVNFVGDMTSADVAKALRSASLTVSAAKVDGSSVSLMESLAAGIQCVIPKSPCNEWWVPDEMVGNLYQLGDIEEMARRMASRTEILLLHQLRRRQLVLERAQLPAVIKRVSSVLARSAS